MNSPNPTLNPVSNPAPQLDPTGVADLVPASVPSVAPSPVQTARLLLRQLQQSFPAFRDCLPLAIGIDKQLIARQPELPRKILRIALGQHTNSLRYLKAVEKAATRFNLDGESAEAVTEEHRKRAATLVRERFKKEADQRKAHRATQEAERILAAAVQAEQEAARLRTEKLQQLAAKFSR